MFPAGRDEFRVRYVGRANEHRLRVVECGPDIGPVVLLVHGWGASAYAFRHTMPALAKAGYRVAAMDLPGHGLSQKPTEPESYRLDSLAQDVSRVLDGLSASAAVLVGHSMGALVAARAALSHGDVRGLVLISPVGLGPVRDLAIGRMLTPAWAARAAPYLARRFAVAVALRFAYAGGDAGALTPTTQDIDEYWAPAQDPGFALALRALLHEFSWQIADPTWLGRIRCPTLVMSGENDRLVKPEGAKAYAQHIPLAQLTLIANAGHAIPEQRPVDVNRAIVTFLGDTVSFPSGTPDGQVVDHPNAETFGGPA